MIDEKLKHIGIILDGNGRWAKERGLNRSMGHKEGLKVLENIAIYANSIGLKILSVYAFSTDNFKRSEAEVDFLMNLFITSFKNEFNKFKNNNIKVIFSGEDKNLPEEVIKTRNDIVSKTQNNTGMILNICLNYGGQEEIIRASKKVHDDLNKGLIKDIDKETFYKYLDNDLPPIDLLIRTGGETRLSNFMLYELSYAEIYFIKEYWPLFTTKMLDDIIASFYHKDRRYGAVNEKEKVN